ncbi:putative ubiquitin interaction domain-containing protein [Erysiphe neolycopersici]|uniref:Putative ubiquitin interaction domain-containing protein n=1 Tax=Erysiphe neolycopersici TaxID=212602 RepID=A0A420H785_9PEZI|nr:putative ubiquitin interaction domain-containing protein [Erysiphe neolycopersici]
MAFDPSEEHIKFFVEMAPGISRKEIIRRIKGNNYNVEQALNEYYDNPDTNKYSSVDNSSDNEQNGSQENHGIFFKIQGDDVPVPHSQYHSAPSRPPSRINNKSPLHNSYSSTGHTIGNDFNDQNQDAELTKALALSAQEAGLNSRDSSINAISFGPATRELYDSNQWSMVPLGKINSAGSNADLEPPCREREPHTPAFLKPSIKDNYLAALITIYHEIPLMRNLFLKSTNVLDTYGYDKQWWMGKPIEQGRQSSNDLACLDIEHELQRLMAFLDDTERSYGSIEPLANLTTVTSFSRAYDGSDKACAFLEAWRQCNQGCPKIVNQVFSAGVASEDTEQDEKQFAILELTIPNNSLFESLYDICDECLWPDLQPLDLDSSPYLSHIAEVITFKIETTSDHKNISFPAIWYPDRYLKHSREASLEMRKKKYEVLEEIDKILKLENRLTSITSKNGNLHSVKNIFEVSLKHDENLLVEDSSQDKDNKDISNLTDVLSVKLSAELKRLIDSIDKKLDELNREKSILSANLRHLSTLNAYQSPPPETPALKPYSLRGLRTTKSTMYICQRINTEIEISSCENDPKQPLDQWWRIHFSTDSTPTFSLERTTTQEVLAAASKECTDPMLVYASEKALSVPKEPLPKPLQTFVQWDNRLFNNELQEERARSETDSLKAMGLGKSDYVLGFSASSPSKRKYVHGDLDNLEMEKSDLERRNSENSVLDIEAPLPGYEDSHLKLDEILVTDKKEQHFVDGIEPSCIEADDGKTDYEMNRSSPRENNTQAEPTDQMDFVFEKSVNKKEVNR